jgi:hypothetical protein
MKQFAVLRYLDIEAAEAEDDKDKDEGEVGEHEDENNETSMSDYLINFLILFDFHVQLDSSYIIPFEMK